MWKQIEKELGENVVVIENLTKEYKMKGRQDAVVALKGITLSDDAETYPIKRGEFLMLRGPSGGGKTTLLNILGTIDKCTEGTINIFGNVIDSSSSESTLSKLRLKKVGFVFQTFNLLATMSAYENVELPMKILGEIKSKERKKRTIELLELVGLQDRMNHLPSELSGGEQQRVTIARSLANKPELLLMDEPTGDLDTKNTIEVMDLILELNKQGTTILMVTHNPDIECYADRILYLRDGQIFKQILNRKQYKLDYIEFLKYLTMKENGETANLEEKEGEQVEQEEKEPEEKKDKKHDRKRKHAEKEHKDRHRKHESDKKHKSSKKTTEPLQEVELE